MPASHQPALADSQLISPIALDLSSHSRLRVGMLVCLTLVGAWLRLWHLGSKSLWLDEAATVALVRLPWSRFVHEWWYGAASFQTTHLLLLRGWLALCPATDTWVRLPSALCGIASIPMLYVLARKLLGNTEAALASAAILAVSPTHVYYSQETRSYTLTILLLLVAAIFLVNAVERDSNRDWALWGIFSVLAVYAHYFAALTLVAQACSVFFWRRRSFRKVLLWGGLILAASLPGMSYVFRAPEFATFSWMPRTTGLGILHVAMFLGGSGLKFALTVLLWIAGTVFLVRSRSGGPEADYKWHGMLVLAWAVIPTALLAAVSLRHPVFVNRYMIFSLPATVMLAAEGMRALRGRNIGLVLVIGLCVLSIPTVIKDYHKPREDWRDATASVLASAEPGDAVVFVPEFSRVAFDYYAAGSVSEASRLRYFSPRYYGDGATAADLQRALISNPGRFGHVWVVVLREFGENESLPDVDSALEEQLQSIFGSPSSRKFQAITVLEFGR